MIRYQILKTNIRRTIWQTVRRITNEILGVKGLKLMSTVKIILRFHVHRKSLFDLEFCKPVNEGLDEI